MTHKEHPFAGAGLLRWRGPETPLPVLTVNRATGAILAANPAACALYGLAANEIIRHNLREIFSDLTVLGEEHTWRTVHMRQANGDAFAAEVTAVGGDEGEVMVLVRRMPSEITRTFLTHRDDARRAGPSSDVLRARVTCDPRSLVAVVVERARLRADAKQVSFVVNVACHAAHVRPDAWSAALYELVTNAVQASQNGDVVFIDVMDLGDGETLWRVQDTGSGMSAHQLAGLGAPAAGVGLVWDVVDNHHGLLRFESSADGGTTATILLPDAAE